MTESNHPLSISITRPIYLMGMPGVGKTSIGKKVANKLQLPFYDLDDLIEKKFNRSISEIFTLYGESFFRKAESYSLKETLSMPAGVLALGGGTPCYYNHMDWLNKHGHTIYICASNAFIYARLLQKSNTRPLFKNLDKEGLHNKISELLAAREPFYLRSKHQINMPCKNPESLIITIIGKDHAPYH
jgi:shikimate kinase